MTNKSRPRKTVKTVIPQLDRFKAMAEEVGADESPGALERSFGRINPKAAKPTKAPAKPK